MSSNPLGASLADASSLLLGLNRPLTKIETEPTSLPMKNPVPAQFVDYGEITRAKKSVAIKDGGRGFADDRFASEVYPIPAPLCDHRTTVDIFGDPSRYMGRAPMLQKK